MRRRTLLTALSLLVIAAMACQESTITGTLGNSVVKGTVVMSGDLTGTDPTGIEVRVPGTGIMTITSSDGYFELAGLPEGVVDLVFRRGDGINETLTVPARSEAVTVELTSRRGRGRPVSKPGNRIQGSILEVRDSSILVDNVLAGETEIFIDENTFIFKGALTLLITDLEAGEMVHIRAYEAEDGTLLAQSISVSPRHAGDPGFLPRSVVGEIATLGEGELTVMNDSGVEVLVKTDERTELYARNILLQFEDLEVGDRVKVFGALLEDGSVLASWIRVKPGNGDDDETDGEDGFGNAVHGEVLSVGEASVVVRDADGLEVTVQVSESTEIRRRGRAVPFEEIVAGSFLTAIGERLDQSTLAARKINISK